MNHRTKSGFTLVELLVVMVIGMIVISGMTFILQSLADNFTAIRYINRVYHELDNFTDEYNTLKSRSPILVAYTGGTSSGALYGFESMVFSNSGNTEGFLLTSADVISSSLASPSMTTYSQTVPAILTLTGGDIASATANFSAFLTSVNINHGKRYTELPIVRLNYTPLNASNIGKLDLNITPSYYQVFQGRSIASLIANPIFEYSTFSYIK